MQNGQHFNQIFSALFLSLKYSSLFVIYWTDPSFEIARTLHSNISNILELEEFIYSKCRILNTDLVIGFSLIFLNVLVLKFERSII